MNSNNDALRDALIDAVTDYRYLLTIVEDRQNLHGWLRMRIGVLAAVIAASKPETRRVPLELMRFGGRCEKHLSVKPCEQCAAEMDSKPEPQAQTTNEHTEQSECAELIRELSEAAEWLPFEGGKGCDMAAKICKKAAALLAADKACKHCGGKGYTMAGDFMVGCICQMTPEQIEQQISAWAADKAGGEWPEEVMRQWDYWRAEIASGNKTSAPRDWFESLAGYTRPQPQPVPDDVVKDAAFIESLKIALPVMESMAQNSPSQWNRDVYRKAADNIRAAIDAATLKR